jgi:hypothetical protein
VIDGMEKDKKNFRLEYLLVYLDKLAELAKNGSYRKEIAGTIKSINEELSINIEE